MKKLILMITFLLLCPSLILAEEKGGIYSESAIKKAGNLKASVDIASEMFSYDFREKYGHALRLWAFLYATGYKNLAEEVIKDVNPNDILELDLFYKHNKRYQYNASDYDMSILSCTILNGIIRGYKEGMIESLSIVFKTHKDIADFYKDYAPKMYEGYLEKKKKAKYKP